MFVALGVVFHGGCNLKVLHGALFVNITTFYHIQIPRGCLFLAGIFEFRMTILPVTIIFLGQVYVHKNQNDHFMHTEFLKHVEKYFYLSRIIIL